MCHNLGADESLDPFTPARGLNGSYYQWNRKASVASVYTGEGAISGWNTMNPTGTTWETANNPCPSGYRVPTLDEWNGVVDASLNPQIKVGTDWMDSSTNFTTGRMFGNALYLPAAGSRDSGNGQSDGRGNTGYYWSSTQYSLAFAYNMHLGNSGANTFRNYRTSGNIVRCISE
jgi:uncharacterized protein (TIGR02145 family)